MKLLLLRALLMGLTLFCVGNISAATIRLNEVIDANARYSEGLIKLALSYSKTPYTYVYEGEALTQGRLIEEVRRGGISIMWAGTTTEMEETLLAVRVPLYKGLLGHRIFIIRRGDQARFDAIKTIDDLRSMIKLGQGRTWSDTQILEANGMNVEKATKYESLFYMVEGARFDAFPRGVQEPWGELASRPDLDLTVEKRLMVVYKMPFYLFVSRDNEALAKDLEEGLVKAIADGSFDRYFHSNPMVQDVLEKANLRDRRAIYLDNPLLSKQTPLDRPEFWLDPYSL